MTRDYRRRDTLIAIALTVIVLSITIFILKADYKEKLSSKKCCEEYSGKLDKSKEYCLIKEDNFYTRYDIETNGGCKLIR